MARGTDFGGIHSHRDLNLIQQKVEVQPAEPKLNLVDVPGADGSKDLSTQPAGRVVYEDRTITWTFALYPGEKWDAKHRQVSNALNGRECRITLGTDPDYYFQGRVAVKKYNIDRTLRQITVEAICRPWILKRMQTSVFIPFSGKNLINPAYLEDDDNFYQKSAVYISVPIVLKPNTTYTISCDSIKKPTTQIVLNIGTGPWESTSKPNILRNIFNLHQVGKTTRTVVSFTTGDAALYYLQYYMNGTTLANWTVDEWLTRMCVNLQLEEGVGATAYEPYAAAAGPQRIMLANERRPVTPTITCQKPTVLTFGGATLEMSAGTNRFLDFQLEGGTAEVTVDSTGAVAITYQEGSL